MWENCSVAGADAPAGFLKDSDVFTLLHTSDWHLGKELIRESTIPTASLVLERILQVCRQRHVDCVMVAGDIFDVTMPSNEAQKLYYSFLAKLVKTGCRHAVVVPGNHDSANFLRAPAGMLLELGVIVPGPEPEDQAVVLRRDDGTPEAAIAAVPFLRESEMRVSLDEITETDRWRLYEQGVRRHYAAVRRCLGERLGGAKVPMVACGHFFASGITVTPDPDTGEVPVTVGTLGAISPGSVGPGWDYVGLGHIHRAQQVSGPAVRYSGSPLPLSFREIGNDSQVVLVTFPDGGGAPEVEPVAIPRFQPMACAEGDVDAIRAALDRIAREMPGAWVEVRYTGVTEQTDLNEKLNELASQLGVKLLAVRNQAAFRKAMEKTENAVPLEDLEPEQVFRQFLIENHEDETVSERLRGTFAEVLADVRSSRAAARARVDELMPEPAGETPRSAR